MSDSTDHTKVAQDFVTLFTRKKHTSPAVDPRRADAGISANTMVNGNRVVVTVSDLKQFTGPNADPRSSVNVGSIRLDIQNSLRKEGKLSLQESHTGGNSYQATFTFDAADIDALKVQQRLEQQALEANTGRA